MTDTLDIPEIIPAPQEPQGEYDQPLYKKWFKAGGNAGFVSITPFRREGRFVGRFIVDIGKVNPNSNSVESSTKCYIDAVQLAVYLKAVAASIEEAKRLFPKRSGTNSNESFIAYGGTPGAEPVARVFKIEYWGSSSDGPGPAGAFAWKCGHFKGNVTQTGAITANMSEPLSQDMIKVSRVEMAEIAYRLDLAMHGFAAEDVKWYE